MKKYDFSHSYLDEIYIRVALDIEAYNFVSTDIKYTEEFLSFVYYIWREKSQGYYLPEEIFEMFSLEDELSAYHNNEILKYPEAYNEEESKKYVLKKNIV